MTLVDDDQIEEVPGVIRQQHALLLVVAAGIALLSSAW
jgi:hypothetical protein